MNISKEICIITKSIFQQIREELDRDYDSGCKLTDFQDNINGRLDALKNAVDKLLVLLDKAVS